MKITSADSCLTYALKRVGLFDEVPIRCAEEVEKCFELIEYEPCRAMPYEPGTLFLWKAAETEYWTNGITEDGVPVTRFRPYSSHLAVLEKNGLVSDAGRKGYRWITIRCRFLNELPSLPQYVLKLKPKELWEA